ncbi:MAG: hypothetical protein FWD96_00225 [Defluviitaleaceae bacterium]|nr:hypothetical protein [Defluviitaleaceae bacterium]
MKTLKKDLIITGVVVALFVFMALQVHHEPRTQAVPTMAQATPTALISYEEAVLLVHEELESLLMNMPWAMSTTPEEEALGRTRTHRMPPPENISIDRSFPLSTLHESTPGSKLADMIEDGYGWVFVVSYQGRPMDGIIVTRSTGGVPHATFGSLELFDNYLEYYTRYGRIEDLRIVYHRYNTFLLINGNYDVIEVSRFSTNPFWGSGISPLRDNLLMDGAVVAELIFNGKCLSLFWQYYDRPESPPKFSTSPLQIDPSLEGLITMEVTGRHPRYCNLLTVVITNNSGRGVTTGFPFDVEFFNGTDWVRIPGNVMFLLPGLSVRTTREFTKNIDMFPYAEPGLYRIRKEISVSAGSDPFGLSARTRHDLVAEFYRHMD